MIILIFYVSFFAIFIALGALILGTVAIVQIERSERNLTGRRSAWVGVASALACLVLRFFPGY